MKRFGLFFFFSFLFSFMRFCIVDDEGAGGDGGGDEYDGLDDFEIVDDEKEDKEDDKSKQKPKEPPKDDKKVDERERKEGESLKEHEERLKKLEKAQAELENERALFDIEKELSKKYEGFSLEKIQKKLREMEEKEPGSGEMYNNPVGFELLWLKEFAKGKKSVDAFDMGREEKKVPFDVDKAYEAMSKGDKKARLALLENSK